MHLPNVEFDVTTSKIPFLSLLFRKCIAKSNFRKIYMSIRPISEQTKVQLEILQLFVVTFDMSCLRRTIHLVQTEVAYKQF